MKTKIITACLFATAFATTSNAQNSFTPAPTTNYMVTEVVTPVTSTTETFFGADFSFEGESAKITSIIPYSPAETFNFRKGDLVTAIGNYSITSASSLQTALTELKPGSVVTVSYTRNGKAKTRKVKLEKINVVRDASK